LIPEGFTQATQPAFPEERGPQRKEKGSISRDLVRVNYEKRHILLESVHPPIQPGSMPKGEGRKKKGKAKRRQWGRASDLQCRGKTPAPEDKRGKAMVPIIQKFAEKGNLRENAS